MTSKVQISCRLKVAIASVTLSTMLVKKASRSQLRYTFVRALTIRPNILKPYLIYVCALLENSVPESHWAREFDQGAGLCRLGGQGAANWDL